EQTGGFVDHDRRRILQPHRPGCGSGGRDCDGGQDAGREGETPGRQPQRQEDGGGNGGQGAEGSGDDGGTTRTEQGGDQHGGSRSRTPFGHGRRPAGAASIAAPTRS